MILSNKELSHIASNTDFNLAHKLSHTQFVDALNSNEINYILIGDPNSFLAKAPRQIFNLVAALYLILPAIAYPLFCYFLDNWWLMIAMGFSYFGTVLAVYKSKVPIYLLLLLLGSYFSKYGHIISIETLCYISMLWGYFWFKIADQMQIDFARYNLMYSQDLYKWAVKYNRIIVSEK